VGRAARQGAEESRTLSSLIELLLEQGVEK
jgi:hypothetical protein